MARIPRREFIRQVGATVVGGALVSSVIFADAPQTQPASVGTIKDLPRRKLGRISIDVPVLSFGTAPMGHAMYEQEPFEEVINAALEAGIVYLDTAPIYDVAQQRLAPILEKRRKDVFLVTKTRATTRDNVLRDLEKSLKTLGTDHADLCHIHNLADFPGDAALGKGGTLDGLIEARKRGWIHHIGCSGHMRPAKFQRAIETGEIALIMVAMNFVDRHTYNFEESVLPIAVRHNTAIVAMKVYGGVTGSWDGYRKKRPGRLASDPENRQMAIDYALSIPNVSTCVIGMKSVDELRLAIQAVRNHKPLEGKRRDEVFAKGAQLAAVWKDHFGPVS